MSERLFTPRFFIMCAYTFTVFVSVFQLLPTAPYHVLDLGGGTTAAGLFLGFLTYSSAISAPFTGSIGDRIGQRRVLITVSLILSAFTASYAFIDDYRVMLGVVIVHGLFWSGLLSASGAYMTSTLPASTARGGTGLLGTVVGAGHRRGARDRILGVHARMDRAVHRAHDAESADGADCLAAARRSSRRARRARERSAAGDARRSIAHAPHHVIEWRVLLLSVGLALISFALRQPDELLGAVCGLAGHLAAQPVPVGDGRLDALRQAAGRADRSIASAIAGCCCDVWSCRRSAWPCWRSRTAPSCSRSPRWSSASGSA